MQKVIDAHIHLSGRNDDELIPYALRNGLRYTLAELVGLMEENGVAHGLLLSPPLKGGKPLPNKDVVELCGKSRGRLSPVFTVEPKAEQVADAVKLARRNRGLVKGFKVRLGYVKVFADDRVFAPLYDYAESVELPVMYHTGDTADSGGSLVHAHPLTLDSLANSRPNLRIVACHFGNPWFDDVAELIYKHPNVYADVSGLVAGKSKYSEKYADWLAERLSAAIYFSGGADKVIFGTDYPVTTYATTMALVRRMGVDGRDMQKIFWKNARKVFRV